jgi:hypothetical protein
MIKEIEVDAPLETLNKLEKTGLPCKWHSNEEGSAMVVTVNTDSPDELVKFGKALEGCKKVTYKCIQLKVLTRRMT